MYTKILHATDLGHNHYALSDKASKFAQQIGAELHLIFVLEPPTSLQIAQSLGFAEFDEPAIDEAKLVLGTLGDALDVPQKHQYIEVGSAKQHIIERANHLKTDLIIIGSHTPANLPPILGSTAHHIVHQAKSDVLTIRVK